MTRHAWGLVMFIVGACTTAAVRSTASAPPAPDPAAEPPAAKEAMVVHADAAQRRTAPGGDGAITILARGDNAFVGKLELAAGGEVPEHRDATEEYIHVVSGTGRIVLDGQPHEIGPGDTVYMPADARVSFENGDAPLVAFQVFAGPEPAAKYDGWTPQ